MRNIYVEFYNNSIHVQQIKRRDPLLVDVTKSSIFRFFDVVEGELEGVPVKSERLDISGWYFRDGKKFTYDEACITFPDKHILLDNMKYNGFSIVFINGNFIPFYEDKDHMVSY